MQPAFGEVEPFDPPETEQELDLIQGGNRSKPADDRSQRLLQIRG
jgi:hypothetical protein